MSDEQRTTLLSVIWFSMGITSIGVAVSGKIGPAFFTPLLIAMLATFVFVSLPSILSAVRQQREKAKNQPQDRAALLLSLLNEDERAAFKAALQQRVLDDLHPDADGELPDTTLAALLDDHDTSRAARK